MWLRKVRFSSNLLLTLILLTAIFCLIKFKTIYSQIDEGGKLLETKFKLEDILINRMFWPTLSGYPFVFHSYAQTESMIEDIIVKVLNNTNNTHQSSPVSATEQVSEKEDIKTESVVTLWIDLPNIFPWRRCVQEYNNLLTVLDCNPVNFRAKMFKFIYWNNFRI